MNENVIKRIFIIVGHSGAGKTVLTKLIGTHYACEVLNFSEEGKQLACEQKGSIWYNEIIKKIYRTIFVTMKDTNFLVIDGLISARIIDKLKADGFEVHILYLFASYKRRIMRMAQRYGCEIGEALLIEKEKAVGKSKGGIEQVIDLANVVLDGNKAIQSVLRSALTYIDEMITQNN